MISIVFVQISPQGDAESALSDALDNPTVNVTVLLPTEELLQNLATAIGEDTSGTLTPEAVQICALCCFPSIDSLILLHCLVLRAMSIRLGTTVGCPRSDLVVLFTYLSR